MTGVDADLATLHWVTNAMADEWPRRFPQSGETKQRVLEAPDALARVEAELSRLGALYSCGYATGQGQNCGKCQQCLLVHEYFLKEACEQYKAELSRLREQITELLQQESFMERKMAAQREDIERLAARVEAAEARCARLQQALVGVASGRCIHSPLITSASPLSRSGNFYSTLPEECPRCIAREALAGLGSGQCPVTGSESAQDTPTEDRYQIGDSPHNKERPRDDGTPGATT